MIELTESQKSFLLGLKSIAHKYLARDKDGELYAYQEEPTKVHGRGEQWYTNGRFIPVDTNDFDFIKWEDEKPTSIDDLLAEQEEPKVTPIAEIKVNFSEDDIKNLIEKTLLQNDYAPVIHAHWTDGIAYNGKHCTICSNCGSVIPSDSTIDYIDKEDNKHCYNCGAIMDEVIDDD